MLQKRSRPLFNFVISPFQICIVESINNVLREAKLVQALKKNVPQALSENDVACMKVVLKLLEPMAQLTDDLQADSVTSSLVIVGVINAIQCNNYLNNFNDKIFMVF
jgi:hypothetical protein